MAEKTSSLELSDSDAAAKTNEGKEEDAPVSKQPSGGFKNYLRIFQFADRLSWTLYIISSISGIASGVVLPVMAIIFGNSISQFNGFSTGGASSDKFKSQVLSNVYIFIYLFVAKFVLTYISMVCISIAGLRTTGALRKAFLAKTLRQEIWHFDSQGTGAVANQVTTNGTRVNQGIADQLAILIQSAAMFFAAFIVALAVQWKLTLITMTVIPAIFLFVGGCIAVDAPIESRIIRIYSKGGKLAEEVFSSIKNVHAFWAQDKMVKKYDEFLEEAHKEGKKKSIIYGILFSTQYFFIYSGTALAYWQGYRMFASGEIANAGTVFTVVFSVSLAATAIGSIAPQFPQFTNAAGAASELFEVLDKPSLLDPLAKEGESPEECRGDIKVKGLTFAYPTRPSVQVLTGLDISIPAGKTTALVGASGCGKSTLVGLLERWYERASGSIELDGLDISKYNTKWLRSRIRLVQQEPVLFRGTVLENVLNGLVDSQLDLPKEKQNELAHEACKASYAHDFILELPHGYDTEVGERAGMLSGGQRQRIAIARSIISNPRILLLDEATSALDPKAEKIVQKALDEISTNRTTLVIAHKLATVKSADNIAVIHNGAVAEQGSHEQLMKADGLYAKLVSAQDLGDQNDNEAPDDDEDDEKQSMYPELLRKQTSLIKPVYSDDQQTKDNSIQAMGTMGYSLIRCIIIMLGEQKSLYRVQLTSLFFCLVAGATFPGQAVLFSRLLRAFTLPPEAGQKEANFYALMFFILALGNLLAYFVIGINCNIIGQEVTHRYRHEMFSNIIKQDISFFDLPENTSGALTSNVSALPTQLQDLISANILLIVIIFVNVIASAVVAIAFGWKLGLVVVFGGFPPLLISGYVRIRIESKLESMRSTLFANSASLASEVVVSMKTVSSLTLETTIIERYSDQVSTIVQTSMRTLLVTLIGYALSQSLLFLIMALGFWYGSQLLASGEYNITQFYVIFIGVIFAGQAAAEFFGYTTSISRATGAANYILWLRSLKPTMQEDSSNHDSQPDSKDGGNLALSSLSFNYAQRKSPVLRDLSMTIPAGQFAAFVGPSGCGKSTMISLLERFYDPTTGEVQFAGKALSKYSPRLYRQNVSLVQQEPTLYSGSVRENVALGLEGVDGREKDESEDRIIEACRQANALEFVQSLPEGLSTPCGSRGLQFSGGQKQRIAIARALIRKPRLLLLDEATSALDTQSERVVQAALDQAKEGRTTIAVAHRLSTIKHADAIFVFGNGRIEEQGTHEELLAKRGRYYEMCLVQSLDQAM